MIFVGGYSRSEFGHEKKKSETRNELQFAMRRAKMKNISEDVFSSANIGCIIVISLYTHSSV